MAIHNSIDWTDLVFEQTKNPDLTPTEAIDWLISEVTKCGYLQTAHRIGVSQRTLWTKLNRLVKEGK